MKSGTVITCPDCRLPQIKSTKDLKPGGLMGDAEWISMGWDMDGMRMGCYSCSVLWSRKHPVTGSTQVHTEDNGWVALSKTNEKKVSEKPKLFIPDAH